MNIYQIRQQLKTRSIYDLELKVAYYARVSSDKEEQKNSTQNQISYFEDLIKSNKAWTFAGGYVDDGISGMHAEKREEFQRLLNDAKIGKYDLLLTKEISRFARNTLDSIQYTRQLLTYGVCVWFQNDNINTIDEDSEFRLTIMAGVAQDEIRKLSSRVKFGHAQAIKKGVVLGNSRLYGYDKDRGKLVINPDEAEMVKMIFQKYAYENYSTPQLEKLLYDKGYRNHNGAKISRDVIKNIIRNPKYKGFYVGGKVKIVDMFTKKQEFLPQEDWHMYKDNGETVPAIVNEATWEAANKRLEERGNAIKSHKTSYKRDNTFTGKIYCGNDGAAYWMKQRTIREKWDPRWVCSYRIKNGAESCSSFGIAESELKSMLADLFNSSGNTIDTVLDEYLKLFEKLTDKRQEETLSEQRSLEDKISQIKKKRDKLLDFNLSGAISDDEFIERNADFKKQMIALQDKLSKIQARPETSSELWARLDQIKESVKQYSNITPEDITKMVVDQTIQKIVVYPKGEQAADIRFHLKSGEAFDSLYHSADRKKPGCSGDILFTI
ncbi:MAG: recombinase family protein [Lachnospiraceae bacterium]|nr:recombinase family protein [Lachnospiraceae bacterium]